MTLSVMCITRMEPHAAPFLNAMRQLAKDCAGELVLGFDGGDQTPPPDGLGLLQRLIPVDAQGCLENVHDYVLGHTRGDYVLRLDDDERCSPAMVQWLRLGSFKTRDHWKFPRAHLWGSDKMMLLTPHLWPDCQTRLSIRAKAGGRTEIHAGSPFGGGELAPVLIEHHKFLVRSREQRQDIVTRYDSVAAGAGTAFMPFNVPEIFYKGESIKMIPLNDGRTDVGHYEQGCGGCGKWVTL